MRDDVEIAHGIDGALDVRDLRVLKDARDVEDTVDGADVREEGVAEALALVSAAHQAGNVGDAQMRRHDRSGLERLAQEVEASIGHLDAT